MAGGYGSRPNMDGWPRWMTGDWWQEMDLRRWNTGDGWHSSGSPVMNILRLSEVISSSRSLTLISRYEVTMELRYADIPCSGGIAPEYDTEHYSEHYAVLYSVYHSEISNCAATWPSFNAVYDPESDPESLLQCRYHKSCARLIFGGATIIEEGDENAVFTTVLIAYNHCTGNAGTKHPEMHSPIEKRGSAMCTQRSESKHTYRWIKKLHVKSTIPDEIPTQSRQSRHTQLLGEINFRVNPDQSLWHQKKP